MPRRAANHYRAATRLRREMTRSELLLWEQLRGRRFRGLKFRRQHPLGRFILDFYCPELKLAVEVDGAVHHDPGQARIDAARQQFIEAQGLTVVRVDSAAVERDPNGAVEAALAAVLPLST